MDYVSRLVVRGLIPVPWGVRHYYYHRCTTSNTLIGITQWSLLPTRRLQSSCKLLQVWLTFGSRGIINFRRVTFRNRADEGSIPDNYREGRRLLGSVKYSVHKGRSQHIIHYFSQMSVLSKRGEITEAYFLIRISPRTYRKSQ